MYTETNMQRKVRRNNQVTVMVTSEEWVGDMKVKLASSALSLFLLHGTL